MAQVRRIFVEKQEGFDVAAKKMLADFRSTLGKTSLEGVRALIRYDIEGLDDESFSFALATVFSEPAVDIVHFGSFETNMGDIVFAAEYLPGQYDQRADSAAQCTELAVRCARPVVKCANVYVLSGISEADALDIKNYVINPVDSREASPVLPETLKEELPAPPDVPEINGFCALDENGLKEMIGDYALAMSLEDIKFVQAYYRRDEMRNPTLAEIRVIDTYWSDHCRHTTFLTKLTDISFDDTAQDAKAVFEEYLKAREQAGVKKDICLMDIATLYAKEAKQKGLMKDFDESEEINACSIRQKVMVDGKLRDYIIMFKNETHNHPTEIEPFGGAATCLGGAIRDPLSGRGYVYHAMRVTGSGDPREAIADTMPGKLPQRKICRDAAAGYSSYGNQIGLATGLVDEIYHKGYKAKRMEIGAVVGAAPAENVVRKKPRPDDLILLLGGATGRDGCGGATGSSKAHDKQSIDTCGAQVQKGDPLTERKLQRLFRNGDFSKRVKRCNDFGAGGVCVAIGELADGVSVNLDLVRKKYEGLSGIELAISESQERMAVVIDPKDLDAVLRLAAGENLHAAQVATVTDRGRMELIWRGKPIVSIKREFLNTNGAASTAAARVSGLEHFGLFDEPFTGNFPDRLRAALFDINICSKKGLIEMFDSTVGAAAVTMPLGGKNQLTPVQAMAAKVAADGDCEDASLFSFGFDPYMMEKNPFIGAVYSVVLSLAKLAASGGDINRARLTLQEYFERMTDAQSWGKPLAALLGAWWAQRNLNTPAIGGKDSMSGTFEDINVPPTLVSFALCIQKASRVISPEFKRQGSGIYRVRIKRNENGMPCFDSIKELYAKMLKGMEDGSIISACAVERGGVLAAVSKMAFGNNIGAKIEKGSLDEMFGKAYGDIIIEGCGVDFECIGTTGGDSIEFGGESVSLSKLRGVYESALSGVYPPRNKPTGSAPDKLFYAKDVHIYSREKVRPRVIIPAFPGTNGEYDSANAFNRAGGIADIFPIRNLCAADIEFSIVEMSKRIRQSQILVFSGGFSGGDEPDGSGKFIAALMREPRVSDAVYDLLDRDGLILGICNGFQALIKLGLVPYGEILKMRQESPTLTFNNIGRHVSRAVRTRVSSNASPWLINCRVGDIFTVPVSHGEGRFSATVDEARYLLDNGLIASQYVDENGVPTMGEGNPNGSLFAVEGLLSPDGRILGKMGHNERCGSGTLRNVPGEKDQRIFESGVNYFL